MFKQDIDKRKEKDQDERSFLFYSSQIKRLTCKERTVSRNQTSPGTPHGLQKQKKRKLEFFLNGQLKKVI